MRIVFLGLVLIMCTVPGMLKAQKQFSAKPRNPIICYGKPVDQNTVLSPPTEYLKSIDRRNTRTKSATFDVSYVGFTPEAKAAFQRAVDIWSTLITSSQTIHVTAQWQKLDPGVLGSAIWGSVHANFPGAQQLNTYYPVALAEKIAGRELNNADDADIAANFSSSANWSYNLTGTPEAGKYDLVTVVLHELGHGLGLVDSYSVSGTQGTVGIDAEVPIIFDLAIENNAGQSIFKNFTSPSATLKAQLTTAPVFYNSPLVRSANGGVGAKVYAPSTFDAGSSISHWDELNFPAGNANSLMTPQIGMAEVMQSPGPIMLAALSDMGWVNTSIDHTPLANTENIAGPYVVKAIISSDAEPVNSILLHYVINGVESTIAMASTGVLHEYSAIIPTTNITTTYLYFISANDNIRSYTNPGKFLNATKTSEQNYYSFTSGPDSEVPLITHTQTQSILNTDDELKIDATVTDNLGIEKVMLEYQINSVAQAPKNFTQSIVDVDLYSATIPVALNSLQAGDIITYRIIAQDKATAINKSYNPSSTSFHSVKVVAFKAPKNFYVNNFNTASEDFYGEGFSITTPAGFANAAIHSEHPYKEGNGFQNDERNIIYKLLVPVQVAQKNAILKFDEITLAEPGEPGAVFGDADFYDYVIVEGSSNRGTTWKALEKGYNSKSNPDWLNRYNSSSSGNNSTAKGDASLYRNRIINLLDTFSPGDEVIFRFRLYSDPFSAGWGWAIDNLQIQDPVTTVEELSLDKQLKIYPTLATNDLTFEILMVPSESITVDIINAQGQSVSTTKFAYEPAFKRTLDIHNLPGGLYIFSMTTGGRKLIAKFIKTN